MKRSYVVGVDLGGTKIYTALVDLVGNIIKEKIIPTESHKGAKVVLERIFETIDFVLEGIDKDEIIAIGVGSPGPLNIKKGEVEYTPNIPFKDFKIVEPIEGRYNIKTYLDNDANVATLAEFMFGSGKGTENLVYITASTGVGAGAIINGKLFRGNTYNALEIGHTTVMRHGPRCGCGNIGCLESLASGTAIARRGNEAVNSGSKTSLKDYEEISSKEVFIEASKGDRVSKEIVEEALSYLGIGVANIITTLDPEVVILGGGVINAGEIVLETVKREVSNRCISNYVENCRIVCTELEGKAGVLGAAALAITESQK